MYKVNVADDGRRQDFKRAHSDGTKDSTRQQRVVAVRKVAPDGGDEQHEVAQDDDWPPTKLDRESVGYKTADANGKDGPPQPSVQGVVRHMPLIRHQGKARTDHRSPRTDDGGVNRDDQKKEVLLPLRPVQGVSWRFARLGNKNNVFIPPGTMLETRRITAWKTMSERVHAESIR